MRTIPPAQYGIMDASWKMNIDRLRCDADAVQAPLPRRFSTSGRFVAVAGRNGFASRRRGVAKRLARQARAKVRIAGSSIRPCSVCVIGAMAIAVGSRPKKRARFGRPTTCPPWCFLHGNRTDAEYAVTKGWYTYDIIRSCVSCRGFRYVIWSWPAERLCRNVVAGQPLEGRLQRRRKLLFGSMASIGFDRGAKVSLVGHSFGPRIITGALHLLGGGEIDGRMLPPETVSAWSTGKRNKVRAVLLASRF